MQIKTLSLPDDFDSINVINILKYFKYNKNGCLEWQRSCMTAGYGQVIIHGKNWAVHKLMFLFYKGDLQPREVVRHTCHNPKCGNPHHLIAGTHKDNWKDSEDVHRKVSARRRKIWFIKGVKYSTIREASKKTGLNMSTIVRHSTDGVFNYESYVEGCKKGNSKPKI